MNKPKRIRKNILIGVVGFTVILVIFIGSYVVRPRSYKMLILGDSISEGAGVSDVSLKWYKFLSPYFEEQYGIRFDIDNVSMGGSASYAGYSNLMRLNPNENYDLIIICYGENDSEKEFGLYYESILYNIMLKYPDATVFSILESSQREYTNKMQIIQKMCKEYNVRIIDTIKAFAESGMTYEELCDDGTHPNDDGHYLYYETVRDVLEDYFSEKEEGLRSGFILVPNQISTVDKPLDDRLLNWGNYTYIPVNECGSIDKNVISIPSSVIVPGRYMIGMDFDCIDGQNSISIISDGNNVAERVQDWNFGFAQKHIEIITPSVELGQNVQISFSSDEQLKHFHGICFTEIKE